MMIHWDNRPCHFSLGYVTCYLWQYIQVSAWCFGTSGWPSGKHTKTLEYHNYVPWYSLHIVGLPSGTLLQSYWKWLKLKDRITPHVNFSQRTKKEKSKCKSEQRARSEVEIELGGGMRVCGCMNVFVYVCMMCVWSCTYVWCELCLSEMCSCV